MHKLIKGVRLYNDVVVINVKKKWVGNRRVIDGNECRRYSNERIVGRSVAVKNEPSTRAYAVWLLRVYYKRTSLLYKYNIVIVSGDSITRVAVIITIL